MIVCLCYSSSDGWAVVQENDTMFILRPPYNAGHRTPLTQVNLRRLLDSGDFLPTDQSFNSYRELTSFLDNEVRRYRALHNPVADAKTIAFRALGIADLQHIEVFLDGVEEFCRCGTDLPLVEESVLAVLELPIAKKENALFDRCMRILKDVHSIRSQRNSALNNPVDLPKACPLSIKHYGADNLIAMAVGLSNRRSIFAF